MPTTSKQNRAHKVRTWIYAILAATLCVLVTGHGGCVPEIQESGSSDAGQQVGRQDRGRSAGGYTVYTSPGDDDSECRGSWCAEPQQQGATPPESKPKTPPKWTYGLTYSDVILTPDGNKLLVGLPVPGPNQGWSTPGLALVAYDLSTEQTTHIAGQFNVRRINFSPDGAIAWLLAEDGMHVTSLNLKTLTTGDSVSLNPDQNDPTAFTVVDVHPGGRYLVLSNLPTSEWDELWFAAWGCLAPSYQDGAFEEIDRCRMAVIDTKTDKSWTVATEAPLRDLDFLPGGTEVLATWSSWQGDEPKATALFYDLTGAKTLAKVNFPNCADEVVLVPGRDMALLAPSRCRQDPISILDTKKRKFVKNLPGFGPVAVTPDGKNAIGFTRRDVMVSEWGYHEQNDHIGLIRVDLDTLKWTVHDYGQATPAYTITKDGKVLYAWHGYSWKYVKDAEGHSKRVNVPGKLERFAVGDMSRTVVDGADGITSFVWSTDGKTMYFIDHSVLYSLPAGGSKAETLLLSPKYQLLNLRPQGDALVLGRTAAAEFRVQPLSPKGSAKSFGLQL